MPLTNTQCSSSVLPIFEPGYPTSSSQSVKITVARFQIILSDLLLASHKNDGHLTVFTYLVNISRNLISGYVPLISQETLPGNECFISFMPQEHASFF